MFTKTKAIERPYSKDDLVSSKKIVAMIKEAKKDPEFIKAAKEFYFYHTGKKLKISK